MALSSPLLLFALTLLSFPSDALDASGLPAPQPEAKWVEAVLAQWAGALAGSQCRRQPEHVAMYDAILDYNVMPGKGWFGPSEQRLGWRWIAGQMDTDHDGQITREEFRGPDEFFDRLDRNQDGMLTEADFSWPMKTPPPMPKVMRVAMGPPQDMLMRALLRGELGSPYEGPRVGQRAPLFTLPTQDGKRTIALADQLGDKPVVLIFGSFT